MVLRIKPLNDALDLERPITHIVLWHAKRREVPENSKPTHQSRDIPSEVLRSAPFFQYRKCDIAGNFIELCDIAEICLVKNLMGTFFFTFQCRQ